MASIAPRDLEDARRLCARVPAKASVIEHRLDMADGAIAPARLLELDPRPALVTWRTAAEGGGFAGSPEEYRRRVREAYAAGALVDVEHSSGLLADTAELPDRRRVVVSCHSPFSLPADFEARLEAMRASRAGAVKLVAGAPDVAAAFQIAAIQKRQTDPTVAVFPMGPGSPPGRVLSAFYGASLVYGPVEGATASGQVPLADLLGVYAVDRPRSLEALFGIVGADVSGSLSPLLHNTLFREHERPWLYLPLPVADFDRVRPYEIGSDPPVRGLSVTQPWKLAAAQVGRASEDVAAAGAANTLLRDRGGWRSENTDVDGIFDPLADHDTGEGRAAVVLGAGGVARAAVVASRKLGYEVLIASRDDARADALADALGVDSLAWEDVAASEADLYVNATPIGGQGDDGHGAVPAEVLERRPLVFDCVYRRDGLPTPTIRAARAARCPVVDGLEMFAAQGLRQAHLFGVSEATPERVREILQP